MHGWKKEWGRMCGRSKTSWGPCIDNSVLRFDKWKWRKQYVLPPAADAAEAACLVNRVSLFGNRGSERTVAVSS